MSDDTREDMPDLSVRELKTEMDGRFHNLKTEMDGGFRDLRTEMDGRFRDLRAEMDAGFRELKTEMNGRFAAVDHRSHEEHIETRRHFDVVAEQLRTDMKLIVEGCYSRLDNHERRIQALEKRRR
jgi:hypothetical protein